MKGQRLLKILMTERSICWGDLVNSRYPEHVAKRVDILVHLKAEGLTTSEIARLLDRDHTSIMHWLSPGRRERRLARMREYCRAQGEARILKQRAYRARLKERFAETCIRLPSSS